MRNRYHQIDVTHTLSTYLFFSYLNTTAVANDTLVTDTLVFSAMAFIILDRTKYALTEQPAHFGLITAIVDGFGFDHLTETAT